MLDLPLIECVLETGAWHMFLSKLIDCNINWLGTLISIKKLVLIISRHLLVSMEGFIIFLTTLWRICFMIGNSRSIWKYLLWSYVARLLRHHKLRLNKLFARSSWSLFISNSINRIASIRSCMLTRIIVSTHLI